MGEKVELKPESLLNLDDLLQCPVCYEIPTGQIFQCNEGHHVCGRCKVRLDVCPVCRALFFGTRNYAMEELIANFRKLRAFKSAGKGSAGSGSSASSTTTKDAASTELENDVADENIDNDNESTDQPLRAPPACKGLFRCLCCKIGKAERLPTARLLNHLRYFHAPDLIEGRSENGEYLQAWHFSTTPGRLVTAVRVAEMGIFFLIIEIGCHCIHAWLTMASSPWVAQTYNYTITLSGVDREAIFTDCVWSVRSCEGTLKKRGHCLKVSGLDARALLSAAAIGGRLSVRPTPPDQLANQTQPRAVMRVANRGSDSVIANNDLGERLEPFLQDLQNDVARLSRAFASLGREASALARSEAQIRARMEGNTDGNRAEEDAPVHRAPAVQAPEQNGRPEDAVRPLSRNARRRMRQRLRAVLNETQHSEEILEIQQSAREGLQLFENILPPIVTDLNAQIVNGHNTNGSSTGQSASGGNTRTNRRKRRQRR
ncbi:uncharacterized protein [Epargyreus clarus]|uniref:uncharacterized protein n=1 Tax=Epargyreus clarus TaxID=520877 RepID=UPI003C2C0D28